MRAIIFVIACFATASTMACASTPAAPAKAPESVVLSSAEYNPPTEFDMTFTPSTKTPGTVKHVVQEEVTAPRMVSQER